MSERRKGWEEGEEKYGKGGIEMQFWTLFRGCVGIRKRDGWLVLMDGKKNRERVMRGESTRRSKDDCAIVVDIIITWYL